MTLVLSLVTYNMLRDEINCRRRRWLFSWTRNFYRWIESASCAYRTQHKDGTRDVI